MKLYKAVPIVVILPLLNGCITSSTLHAAKTPAYRILPDKVFHVEKAVISEDKQLVIYLEGCLSNSWQHCQFTVSVPVKEIETKAEMRHSVEGSNGAYAIFNYGLLSVSRAAIHAGWTLPGISTTDLKIIPLGKPTPAPSLAGTPYEWEWAYAKCARLLPNTTQTLYIVIERRDTQPNDWPAQLEFIYVDASTNRKYTIIRVEKARVADNSHKIYYCFVPVTIPLDIATTPFQLIGLLLYAEIMKGLGSTP